MFRLLRAGLDKYTEIRTKLATGSGGVEFYRSIVEEIRPLLEQEMKDDPIDSFPPARHPETGLRRIPVWAVQPYVRPLSAATYQAIKKAATGTVSGAMEDLLTGGTGEERVIAQGKSRFTRSSRERSCNPPTLGQTERPPV
jgi:hypothetical protein